MRQYRGLTKDGNWYYGNLIVHNAEESDGIHKAEPLKTYIQERTRTWISEKDDKCWRHLTFQVIPESVGQQTGLKDKNGKEIYFDSDIVNYTYISDRGGEEEEEFTVTGIVVLDLKHTNSICVLEKRNGRTGGLYHFTAGEVRNIEIIGNIHQNSDLIS